MTNTTRPAAGTKITLGSDPDTVWTVKGYEDDQAVAVLTRRGAVRDYDRVMNWTRPLTDADFETITKRVVLAAD